MDYQNSSIPQSYIIKPTFMTTFSLKQTLVTVFLIVLSINAFSQSNTSDDERMKIRLGFTSINNLHRQLLVTLDERATPGIDFGFDGETYENHQDDMYWMLEDRRFVIQATDVIDATTILPLGLHTGTDGVNTILIDELQNVPDELEIVIFDTENNTYHNIKNNNGFSIDLPAGTYLNRFELRFADNTEETDSNTEEEETTEEETSEEEATAEVVVIAEDELNTEGETIKMQFINNTKRIAIKNPGSKAINSVELYNFTGQLKAQHNNIKTEKKTVIQTNNLNAGNYIIVINTDLGSVSKKVTVK